MKRITSLSLAIAVGIALTQPIAARAEIEDKKAEAHNGGNQQPKAAQQGHAAAPAKRSAPVESQRSPVQHSRQEAVAANRGHQQPARQQISRKEASQPATGQASAATAQRHQVAGQTRAATAGRQPAAGQTRAATAGRQPAAEQTRTATVGPANRHGNVSTATPQAVNQQRNVSAATSVRRVNHSTTRVSNATFSSYNQSNNYGGRWSSADTHSGWDRNRDYSWGDHQYSWYNGGWLIIDGGFWPSDRPTYAYSSGYGSDSTASSVQASLAQQGYYSGAVDGDLGPASRRAIASYQRDNGLRVTGRINHSLLSSLGL